MKEVMDAILAAVKGTNDTITALRTTVKTPTTGIREDAGNIGIAAASGTGMDSLTAIRNVVHGAVGGAAKVGGDIALTSVTAVEALLMLHARLGAMHQGSEPL
jgi:hypothetical protein